MLSWELAEKEEAGKKEGGRKKILCVTHESVMEALCAERLGLDRGAIGSIFDPFSFKNSKEFSSCEVFPYFIEPKEKT